MSANEPLSEIVRVRFTPTLVQRLQGIADRSVSRELSDHVRYAVEVYVEAEERKAAVHRNGDAEPVLSGQVEAEQ